MGKKKATGMSKRLGFTDRATIAENKDILRYNERLEREAKGLPPDRPERPGPHRSAGRVADGERPRRGTGRPGGAPRPNRHGAAGGSAAGGGASGGSGARNGERFSRPPRPPALDAQQREHLDAALAAGVGETGFDAAGAAVIDRLAAHDSFDRASNAGWELVAGAHAAERTPAEWELLRTTWLRLRLALLEAYVSIKPDLEPALARERKQLSRLERPAPGRRRRGDRPAPAGKEAKRRERPRRDPRAPSPADVARRIATATPAAAVAAPVAAGPTQDVKGPDEPTSTSAEPTLTDVGLGGAPVPALDIVDADQTVTASPQPGDEEAERAAEDLREEHGVLAPPDEAVRDQLGFEFREAES